VVFVLATDSPNCHGCQSNWLLPAWLMSQVTIIQDAVRSDERWLSVAVPGDRWLSPL